MRSSINLLVTLVILGLILLVLGIIFYIFWPILSLLIINQELSLSPASKSFEVWKDTSKIPCHLDFYFFNWTNPEDIRTPGTKPNFVEMGPYSFLERREKINITFHPENSTVSFQQKRLWYFDEENSNGTLQDEVTQLNILAVLAAHKVRYSSAVFQAAVSIFLSASSTIHVTKTVNELLFEGYSDVLIDFGKLAAETVVPPIDKFGWFYERNGSTSYDGHINIGTGQDDIKNVGKMRQWNYKSTTQFSKSPCNAVEGSSGEFWSPGRDKKDIILFSTDICRAITFEYNRTVSHLGMEGYQYFLGDKTLSNDTKRLYPRKQRKNLEAFSSNEEFSFVTHSNKSSSSNPAEPEVVNVGQCFCNGECIPSGLFNVSACRYESPIFVSLPHFFKADSIYRDRVTGMHPTEEHHNFYITVEPTTGISLDVAARLQLNILLQPSEKIGFFEDVPNIFFPIFWFDEYSSTPEDLARPLRKLLLLPTIELYINFALMFLGLVILLYAAVRLFIERKKQAIEGAKPENSIPSKRKMEQVYLDTTTPNEDPYSRRNHRLYPKRSSNCRS